MDIITLDFETYYDKDYSLSKITTEEYVRSALFEIIGVSVKLGDAPGDWYSGDDVGVFLRSMDYSDKAILCHNTLFDGAILAWRYGIRPKLWLDTLSMSRPTLAVRVGGSLKALARHYKLGEKGTEVIDAMGKRRKGFTPAELARYGEYCINDSELTYNLFKHLQKGFPVSELIVIDQVIRMYTEPVIELDTELLTQHLGNERSRKLELLGRLGGGDAGKAKKLLNSNFRFAALLAAMGVEVPMKTSPATGKQTFAFAKTDPGFKALLSHASPSVRAITEVRMGVKSTIEEKRTERLLDIATRGALPVELKYYAAHTGRFGGGGKINLQNLPARRGNTIRQALRAPKGHKFVVGDSAQIEARVLALLAGQEDLLQAFREGRDVYSEFASSIYERPVTKADKTERMVGKTSILGLGYNMGHVRFRETLAVGALGPPVYIDEAEAKRVVYFYRGKNHRIKALWATCDAALAGISNGTPGVIGELHLPYDGEGILLPNGLKQLYTHVHAGTNGFSYINNPRVFRAMLKQRFAPATPVAYTNVYGGKVTENLVQALARIVITEQMAVIGQRYGVILQVHDELVICVPDEEVEAAVIFMEKCMSTPPAWAPTLPVACEIGIGATYGDAK